MLLFSEHFEVTCQVFGPEFKRQQVGIDPASEVTPEY
jgi:hypothetical protein